MHTYDNELFTIRHLISDRRVEASLFLSRRLLKKKKRAKEAMQNVDEGFQCFNLRLHPHGVKGYHLITNRT